MTNAPRTGNLTKEAIFEAADAIRKRGDIVTQDLVRAECGNHGSTSTINKHLKAWRAEHEAIASRISREVTPEVERHGLDLIARISELMGERANERCVQLESGYKAEIAIKEEELVEACAEADHYHASLSAAEARIAELLSETAAFEAANEQHVADAKVLIEKIQDLEADRDVKLLRIQQDQQQIRTLEDKTAEALTSAGRFQGVASRLKEQLTEQNDRLTGSSRIIGAYEESLARAGENEAQMRTYIEDLLARSAGLTMANEALLCASRICLPRPANHEQNLPM